MQWRAVVCEPAHLARAQELWIISYELSNEIGTVVRAQRKWWLRAAGDS
jgi:hypothetical protein